MSPGKDGVELSTLRRGLEILALFAGEDVRLSTSAIADQFQMTKSTAYKYVQTLERAGFLVREADGRMLHLGPRLLELASVAQRRMGLVDVAQPILEEMVAATNETALLAARMGMSAVCLARVESSHSLKLTYKLGATYPLHVGASAQVLIAWLDEANLAKVLGSLEFRAYTKETITTQDGLRSRLAEIRRKGYAVSRGELDSGTFAIAAPIRDGTDRVVASLSLSGPSQRLNNLLRRQQIDLVCEAACRVSSLVNS